MALVQGMQTVLFRHTRLHNPPYHFIDPGSNLKDCTCRGYRDDDSQAQSLGSQPEQIISSEVRKQKFARRAHPLRFSQQDPEWLTYRSTCSGNSHSIGGGRRRILAVGPVYCLKTSEVEQVETDTSAEEKPVNSTVEVKSVDSGTDGWAVKKGLSALDAYFDKLNASKVEEAPSGTSYSEVTANRASTTAPPSSTERSASILGSQNPQVTDTGNLKKEHLETHEEKNTDGLNALDVYFDKLRPTEPEKGKHMSVNFTIH